MSPGLLVFVRINGTRVASDAAKWASILLNLIVIAEAAPTCAAPQSLFEMLVAGGPLMVPILLASFVLVLITFERLVSLRRRRVVPRLFVERFLLQVREGALDRHEALEKCDDEPSYVAQVFAAALRKWGKPAVEVEQAVLDEGERVSNALRKYLRVINGISSVSPLLGLAGTVWGMMNAFNVIATNSAMGRAEMLAGGISVALVTTASGLMVAIPAMILYMYFVGRVDGLVTELDEHGQDLVNLISAEALEERKMGRSATYRRKSA